MSDHDSLSHHVEPDPGEFKRALVATGVIGALFVALDLAPQRDPAQVVAGLPCSVISEDAIGTVLGEPVRLSPTSGTICQYVSTGATSRQLLVTARHDAALPASMSNGTHVSGIGDDAIFAPDALYVRHGSRSYTLALAPHDPNDALQELRLAKLMHRQMIAQNR
jgi:hypothetical protein